MTVAAFVADVSVLPPSTLQLLSFSKVSWLIEGGIAMTVKEEQLRLSTAIKQSVIKVYASVSYLYTLLCL